jgi:ABC-type siderophore export system fused ATPase/permease subunit
VGPWAVTAVQVVAWVACATVVTVAFVKAWPWVRKAFKLVDALTELADFIPETRATLKLQDERIAEIHHETHENNGTSIKDSMRRTENTLDRVERGVKGLYDRTAALERTQPRPPKPITPRRRTPKKE